MTRLRFLPFKKAALPRRGRLIACSQWEQLPIRVRSGPVNAFKRPEITRLQYGITQIKLI